ncbi:MAG TPA: histidine phosphatase family protein [Xanthobacteraceae bacterium]|nr:histidine phosphatase family protein [Xanthobacteraceae bacterium]
MRLLPILLGFLCISSAVAEEATVWDALRAGGHVALVRHAGTVGGSGDPPGFKLEDCATQRNLTLKGKAEARRLGELFRLKEVPVGKVLSSQWCRCIETADLMGLPKPELAPTFNNAFTFRDRIDELTAGARAIVMAWSGPGTLFVMTHGANILPLTGVMPEEGGVVVVKGDPASAAGLRVVGRILSTDY